MVLVILAVMWVVVLVPPLLRSRQDSRPSDSVVSFRRQLSTLQRTGPQLRSAGQASPVRAVYPAGAVRPRTARPDARPSGRTTGYGAYGSAPGPAHPVRSLRPSARQRRRNVLFTLATFAGGTLLLAVASGNRTVWYVHIVADVLVLGYVYLLVQMRKLAEQRRTVHPAWSRAA